MHKFHVGDVELSPFDIAKFLGEQGAHYSRLTLMNMISYFKCMLNDGRVIGIFKDDKLYAIMAFSLGDHYERFYKKGSWDYVTHDPQSSTLYIELLVCKEWTKELRREFEYKFLKKFPHIENIHWHRWADWGDRHVKIKRRNYVRNQSIG